MQYREGRTGPVAGRRPRDRLPSRRLRRRRGRYDLIIDIAGSPTLSRLRRALTPTGTAVIVGGEDAGQLTGMSRQLRALALSPFVRQRLTMLVVKESGQRPRSG